MFNFIKIVFFFKYTAKKSMKTAEKNWFVIPIFSRYPKGGGLNLFAGVWGNQ